MIKKLYNKYKDKNGVTPLDLFKSDMEYVSEEVFNKRIETCMACPNLIKLTKQCNMCGCHMPSKANFELAKCPKGLW